MEHCHPELTSPNLAITAYIKYGEWRPRRDRNEKSPLGYVVSYEYFGKGGKRGGWIMIRW